MLHYHIVIECKASSQGRKGLKNTEETLDAQFPGNKRNRALHSAQSALALAQNENQILQIIGTVTSSSMAQHIHVMCLSDTSQIPSQCGSAWHLSMLSVACN